MPADAIASILYMAYQTAMIDTQKKLHEATNRKNQIIVRREMMPSIAAPYRTPPSYAKLLPPSPST